MMNTTVVYNFGQTVLDSSKKLQALKKIELEAKDPEATHTEGFDDDCEQCEIEKLKKPCSICED